MKSGNIKKQTGNPKLGLFKMLMAMFMVGGMNAESANGMATHQVFMGGGNPEFVPRKHTVMNYAQQNRLAKKRRIAKVH